MDASCNIQEDIHVLRLNHNMCPGFWVHISLQTKAIIFYCSILIAGLVKAFQNPLRRVRKEDK